MSQSRYRAETSLIKIVYTISRRSSCKKCGLLRNLSSCQDRTQHHYIILLGIFLMTATIVSAASFDAWFECIIETFEDGQPTLCEIDSLRRFLGGLITPSAAAELLMTIEGEKSSENDPYPFAELLVEAIVHFQAQQPQFIDLLEALHHLPDNGLCVKYQQNQRLLKSRKQEMLESFALILDDMYRCKCNSSASFE